MNPKLTIVFAALLAVVAAIYYLVFTPVGLLLRLVKGDPLERRLDRSASTHWAKRPPTGDVRRYFRQF